jgi:hypothetical protein
MKPSEQQTPPTNRHHSQYRLKYASKNYLNNCIVLCLVSEKLPKYFANLHDSFVSCIFPLRFTSLQFLFTKFVS